MASLNDGISQLLEVHGSLACAVLNTNSGAILGKSGTTAAIDTAIAGRIEVIRAEQKMLQDLSLKQKIEDILVTLANQYHVIRPIVDKPGLFIYLVLDRAKANLDKARESLNAAGVTLRV